jgi:hypothetical protein
MSLHNRTSNRISQKNWFGVITYQQIQFLYNIISKHYAQTKIEKIKFY